MKLKVSLSSFLIFPKRTSQRWSRMKLQRSWVLFRNSYKKHLRTWSFFVKTQSVVFNYGCIDIVCGVFTVFITSNNHIIHAPVKCINWLNYICLSVALSCNWGSIPVDLYSKQKQEIAFSYFVSDISQLEKQLLGINFHLANSNQN